MDMKLKQANCIGKDIDISEKEITEMSNKLSDDIIQEFADEYKIPFEKAKYNLAEYYVYNIKIMEK